MSEICNFPGCGNVIESSAHNYCNACKRQCKPNIGSVHPAIPPVEDNQSRFRSYGLAIPNRNWTTFANKINE